MDDARDCEAVPVAVRVTMTPKGRWVLARQRALEAGGCKTEEAFKCALREADDLFDGAPPI